ncbi:MAG: hypothetical protein QM786_00440 [Breznakibacter sp.]
MRTPLSITFHISALIVALAWFGPIVSAQTSVYPIRTVATLSGSAPYSLDGFVSQPGKFQVQVLTDDASLANYPVRLRLTLQSSGVRITTSANYLSAPVYLNGGELVLLSADDLAPLFDPANLTFEGYSRNQYAQSGRLPEGVYRVWVDVADYYRNVTVSRAVPAIAMVYLARAPQLSFPADNAAIDPTAAAQTRFSWMAYHPANPGAEVIYRFRLWEVKPEGRNAYEVMNVLAPAFEEEVTGTSLLYGADKPLLQTGMRYVWQVQAVDLQDVTLFQNSGKSNAHTFTYGTSCPTPAPQIEKVSATTARLKWDAHLSAQLYRIDYRASDSAQWNFFTSDTPWALISPLLPSTHYEASVTALCGDEEGDPSATVRFKTSREVNYTCGTGTGGFDLSNTEPLPALYRFDEFLAADFSVEVDEAEGAGGTFSGTGYALVPYLGFTKMKVRFSNVFVNTDRRMVRGTVAFVYDEGNGMVLGFGRSTGTQTDVDPVEWLAAGVGQTVAVDADVAGVSVDGNSVTITLADGTVQTVTARDSTTTVGIINPNGTTAYVADPATGLVYSVPVPGTANGEAANSSSVVPPSASGQYGCTATFAPAAATRYGFDRAGTPQTKPDGYFKRSLNGGTVHWKSLPAGGTDYVTVTVAGDCTTDSLRFLRESGLPVPFSKNPPSKGEGGSLLLSGTAHGDEELLSAALSAKRANKDSSVTQTLTEAGALGLVTYSPIVKTVRLVGVNGSKNKPSGPAAIQQRLNEIYSPAIVSWVVEDGGNVDVAGLSADGFKTAGLALASRYSSDMNRVIDAYNAKLDKNTVVLFFVEASDGDKLGYMPLTGGYGFIFNLGSNVELLAHELAHGAFNLRHTFSSKSFWREKGAAPVFPEKSTSNLLDYAGGTELWKYQWDLIHDPEMILLGFLQDESEGAMVVKSCFEDITNYNKYNEIKSLLYDGNTIFKDLYDYIDKNPLINYCVSEYSQSELEKMQTGEKGVTTAYKKTVKLIIKNRTTDHTISTINLYEYLGDINLSQLNDQEGYNEFCIFHEFCHAAQYLSYAEDERNQELFEVEDRLIYLYSLYRKMDSKVAHNRESFKAYMESMIGSEYLSQYPFLYPNEALLTKEGKSLFYYRNEKNESAFDVVIAYFDAKSTGQLNSSDEEIVYLNNNIKEIFRKWSLYLVEQGGYHFSNPYDWSNGLKYFQKYIK